jgi:hypothetical protein
VVLARRNEGDLPLWQLVMVEDNKLRMRHPKVRLMSSGRSGLRPSDRIGSSQGGPSSFKFLKGNH